MFTSNIQTTTYILKSAESWSSPTHIENFKFTVFNDSDGAPRFNFSGKLLTDLRRVMLTFDIKKKANLLSKDYDINFFKSNVDICNVGKGSVGNYIISFILNGLEKYSNIVIKCPMRKGFLFINNFPTPKQEQGFLPKFVQLSTQNTAWIMIITARANIQKAAAVRIFLLKVHGLIIVNE